MPVAAVGPGLDPGVLSATSPFPDTPVRSRLLVRALRAEGGGLDVRGVARLLAYVVVRFPTPFFVSLSFSRRARRDCDSLVSLSGRCHARGACLAAGAGDRSYFIGLDGDLWRGLIVAAARGDDAPAAASFEEQGDVTPRPSRDEAPACRSGDDRCDAAVGSDRRTAAHRATAAAVEGDDGDDNGARARYCTIELEVHELRAAAAAVAFAIATDTADAANCATYDGDGCDDDGRPAAAASAAATAAAAVGGTVGGGGPTVTAAKAATMAKAATATAAVVAAVDAAQFAELLRHGLDVALLLSTYDASPHCLPPKSHRVPPSSPSSRRRGGGSGWPCSTRFRFVPGVSSRWSTNACGHGGAEARVDEERAAHGRGGVRVWGRAAAS